MRQIIQNIQNKYTPLQIIIGLGILFRLIAVIFSKGFGWFDDHFLIIEASSSWADGYDYNDWLPHPDFPDRKPQGHPLLYVGLHYFIFKFFNIIGLADPQLKMTFIRLLHAAYSLILIIYGYKIVERLSNKKAATYAALFLSLYWFMPFLSVRNLAEFICIPPLFLATWFIIKDWPCLFRAVPKCFLRGWYCNSLATLQNTYQISFQLLFRFCSSYRNYFRSGGYCIMGTPFCGIRRIH
jgi:hypothetical protein